MQPADAIPADLAQQSKFKLLTRVGFAARGILYMLIGILMLRTGRTEDMNGALEYLGQGSGAILLAIMAAGMATYAIWRLSDAALGIENGGHDSKAFRKRAVAGAIGVIYLYLAYTAVRILTQDSSGGGSGQPADKVSGLPAGEMMLYLLAAIMFIAGVSQFQTALKSSFMRRLEPQAHRPLVEWFGRSGYTARGIVFLIIAYLIARAASTDGASQTGGMEQALDTLNGPLQYAVAAGLLLFGAFSLIEARYRRLNEPDAGDLKHEVRSRIGT